MFYTIFEVINVVHWIKYKSLSYSVRKILRTFLKVRDEFEYIKEEFARHPILVEVSRKFWISIFRFILLNVSHFYPSMLYIRIITYKVHFV